MANLTVEPASDRKYSLMVATLCSVYSEIFDFSCLALVSQNFLHSFSLNGVVVEEENLRRRKPVLCLHSSNHCPVEPFVQCLQVQLFKFGQELQCLRHRPIRLDYV